MKSKVFYLTSLLLLASNSFALEGELKSGLEFKANFKSKEDDKSTEKLNEESFGYENTSVNFNALDLKLTDTEYGFDFGTVLKSSRKNILINDWSGEQHNKAKDKKSLNHDIQGKFFVNWNLPKKGKVNPKVELTYFLDNYLKRAVTNNGNIVEEETFDYEFVDGDKKYIGGDSIVKLGLNSKPIDSLDIDNEIYYYANNVANFKKGFPTLKISNGAKYALDDKSNLEFSHNFNLNLRSFEVPYVEEKEKEDDENFAFLNNFVRRYRQDFNFKYAKDDYELNSVLKDNGYYIAEGKSKYDKLDIENHRLNFDIEFKSKYKIEEVNIKNSFKLENKFETVKYMNKNRGNDEFWSLVKPNNNIEVNREFKINDALKLTPELALGLKVILPTSKNVFDKDYIIHTYTPSAKLKLEYEKDKIKSVHNFKKNSEFSVLSTNLSKIGLSLDYDSKSEYKLNDKLKLGLDANNSTKFKFLKDEYDRFFMDTLNNISKLEANSEYNILDKELVLKNKLGFKIEAEYGYVLDGGNVAYIPPKGTPKQPERKDVKEKPEINFKSLSSSEIESEKKHENRLLENELKDLNPKNRNFKNKAYLLLQIQEYNFDTELEHTKKIDKLSLVSNLKLNSKLDVISLVKEKQAKLRNSEEDEKEDRQALEVSVGDDIKYNVGGKIVLTPGTNIKYDFTDKLSLSTKLELPIEFSKLVINKIKDDKRTDKDTYGPADKAFKLRNINPKISVELNYKW